MTRARANVTRLCIAVVLFVLYYWLGTAVSHVPPGALDRAASGLFFGHATATAILLTKLGLFPSYLTVCSALLLLALVRRKLLRDTLLAIVSLLVALAASDELKEVFARPRSDHWLFMHEASYSYSSGHATLSLVFYGFWACVVATSMMTAPRRAALVALLSLVFLAIGWSRMALGAHYATDVVGGYLLGTIVMLVAFSVRSAIKVGQGERGKYLKAPRVEPRVRVGQDFQ